MNNIDYETIISSFDDKGTLLKWLKTIDAEIKGSKVTSSSWRVVEGEESNTAYLTLTTSDGVSFETEGLVIPKTTSAIIIDVINQAIAIYDEDFDGAQTLQEFVEHVESDLEDHSTELGNLGTKLNSVGATNGQVLTSNGDGTSAWKDASGGKVYHHNLIISYGSLITLNLSLYTSSNATLNTSTLASLLQRLGYNNFNKALPLFSPKLAQSTSTSNLVVSYYLTQSGGSLYILKPTISSSLDANNNITFTMSVEQVTQSGLSITDWVTEI